VFLVRNFLLATLLTGVVSAPVFGSNENLTHADNSEISSNLKSVCIRSLSKKTTIHDITISESEVQSFGWFGERVSVPLRDGVGRLGQASETKFIGLIDFGKIALFEVQERLAASYHSDFSGKKIKTIRIPTTELNLDQMVLSPPTVNITFGSGGSQNSSGSVVTVQGKVASVLNRVSEGQRRNVITLITENGKALVFEDTILKVEVVGGSLVRFRAKGEGEVVRGYVVAEIGNRMLRVATSDASGGINFRNFSYSEIDPTSFVVENSPVKTPSDVVSKPRFVVPKIDESEAPLVGGYASKIQSLFAGSPFAVRIPQRSIKGLWKIEGLGKEVAEMLKIPIDGHGEVELGASSGPSLVSELNNRIFSNETPWRLESGYYNFVVTEHSEIRFGLVGKKDELEDSIAFGLSPIHLSRGVGVVVAGQVLIDHERAKIVFNLKDDVFMRDLISNNRIDVRGTIRKMVELFQTMAPGFRAEFSGWLEGAEDGWYVDKMADLFPPELKVISKEELRILMTWSAFRQHNPLTAVPLLDFLRASRGN
jgi:hypothetical protein